MKSTRSILIVLSILCAGTSTAQPKMRLIPGTSFGFGQVYKGAKPSRVVTVQNLGKDTLTIGEVTAQCGCTATMMDKHKIAPSDSGRLSISFNTGSYDGTVTKHVYINSNDPSSPRTTIEFTANVIQLLNPDPNYISFNVSKIDSTYSKVITITNTSKQSVKILGVDSKFESLKVSILKNQLMPGDQTELQTAYHPTRAENQSGTIDLKTDDATQPMIQIRVFSWFQSLQHPVNK